MLWLIQLISVFAKDIPSERIRDFIIQTLELNHCSRLLSFPYSYRWRGRFFWTLSWASSRNDLVHGIFLDMIILFELAYDFVEIDSATLVRSIHNFVISGFFQCKFYLLKRGWGARFLIIQKNLVSIWDFHFITVKTGFVLFGQRWKKVSIFLDFISHSGSIEFLSTLIWHDWWSRAVSLVWVRGL